MATLASYKTIVQNEVTDFSSRGGTIIEQSIQDTYQDIVGEVLPLLVASTEEDVTATASQRYVTPTNTYQKVDKVFWKDASGSTFRELKEITKTEYYENYINSSSGTPGGYYMEANNVYFDVAPDNAGTVRINGYEVQDELSGSTVSIIPDRYEGVIVLGSVARFKAYEGLPDANEYFKLYHGPFFDQGRLGGRLGEMKRQLATKVKTLKLSFFGR